MKRKSNDQIIAKDKQSRKMIIIPLQERIDRYNKIRERIFNENKDEKKTQRIRKIREDYKLKKEIRNSINNTVVQCSEVENNRKDDPRAFIDIQIENLKIPALLDSGASVSLLGKDCSELVANINAKIMPFLSNIRTAGGNNFSVIGKIVVPVKYEDKCRQITFYLCPDLIQRADLGVDFWKIFELAPDIFKVDEISQELLTEYPLKIEQAHSQGR